jgi:hypothetical protein
MKKVKELKEISNLAIKIAENLWPFVDEQKLNSHKNYDISEYKLIFNSESIDTLNIKKISEGQSGFNQYSKLITCKGKGGLAHEICHFLFLLKRGKIDTSSNILTDYIEEKCKSKNVNFKIPAYLGICENDVEKAIGYLYLADNEEIISKITGFVVPKESDQPSDFSKSISCFYDEMKTFKLNDKTLISKSEEAKTIEEYLQKFDNGRLKYDAGEITKYINSQGSFYFELMKPTNHTSGEI